MVMSSGRPHPAQVLLSNMASAILAGDFARAAENADLAFARGIRHPILFKARGLHFDSLGRYTDALANFEEARRLDPRDIVVLDGIAISLARLGDFASALATLDASLAIDSARSATHYLRGWVLESHGDDIKAARAAYLRTLELQPGHIGSMSGLAAIAVREHNWPEARANAEIILAGDPNHVTAHVAMASAEIEDRQFADAERRLRKLLERAANMPLHVRAVVNGLLADALDGQDKVAEAFAAHTAENEDERQLHARLQNSDAIPTVEALVEFLEQLDPGDWQTSADTVTGNEDVQQHVFLMGFPRSGTTLLEQILASHPAVTGMEERECMSAAARIFANSREGLARLMHISDEDLADARRTYWSAVRSYGIEPAGRVFVDKVPMHTIKLPLIAKLFPKAKILFALRDPRDVVLSCFRRHLQVSAATYEFLTLPGAARMYDRVMQIGALSREKLPIDCRVQRHEDLVENFDREARAICDFLGVAWADAMMNFEQSARERTIRSLSASQVRRGLNSDGIGQWRRYAEQLEPVLPVLEPWVRTFGYSPT